jgi:mono/diheme cytochrome c family protein
MNINIKIPRQLKAVGLAALVAGVALSSTFAAARVLRHEAMRASRQRPTEERWLEPATPTSPALVARGRTLFLNSCAHCHGADARGDEGPDLHDVQVSDRYIANIIAHGIKGEMPSFAKKHGADDVAALISYVRSLK